jgi:hypothetical protein
MPSLALKMLLIMAEEAVPPVVVEPVGAPQKKKPKPLLKWLPAVRDYLQWKVSA